MGQKEEMDTCLAFPERNMLSTWQLIDRTFSSTILEKTKSNISNQSRRFITACKKHMSHFNSSAGPRSDDGRLHIVKTHTHALDQELF